MTMGNTMTAASRAGAARITIHHPLVQAQVMNPLYTSIAQA